MPAAPRAHDVIVFGATGFVGFLTAAYLARHSPAGLRWALAGRDKAKLERCRIQLSGINPACAELPLLTADVTDVGSMRDLAEASRVVISTVGPYLSYGEPLVAACAAAGTDYLDLAGEPGFVDRMYLRHHDRAVATGARLVHSSGFEAAPLDLGVYYTVGQLPPDVPMRIDGFVVAQSGLSGGSIQTTLTSLARMPELMRAERERRQAERHPDGRVISSTVGPLEKNRDIGCWAVPMPTIARQVVARSARALERYGPDFHYRHRLVQAPANAAGAALGLVVLRGLVRVPAARRFLDNIVRPGEGPSEQYRDRCWFTLVFLGRAGGRQVLTTVSGGDPGYNETAKIVAESALCLATDELPRTAGQVTPAVAMGQALIDRLGAAGIRFQVRRDEQDGAAA